MFKVLSDYIKIGYSEVKNLSTFDIMIFSYKKFFNLFHHLHKIITISFSNKMTNKKLPLMYNFNILYLIKYKIK